MTNHRASLGIGACALALATALSTTAAITSGTTSATGDSGGETVFPGDDWETASPENMGFDPAVLDEIALDAGAAGSNCLVVVRHGRIVAEWNWNETTPETSQEVFSATKSITSALVGIARDNDALDIAQSASDFIPEWQGTDAAAATVEDLLSNDSGREWTFDLDYKEMIAASDRSAFAIGLEQAHAPDSTWVYNNAAIQTLSEVLQASTGVEPADYAETELFAPIGMADTDMTFDGSGNTNMFFGAHTTCRDLARFGLLFLNDGNWDGQQVISADYVEAATGAPSTDINASYGYLWWLNRPGPVVGPIGEFAAGATEGVTDGPVVPGAPEDMYWARGLYGQTVQVDPGSDTVAVRLGPPGQNYTSDQMARVVTDAFTG